MDESAFCRRFAGRIRGYGLRHLRDEHLADDLVQQVLLAVLDALRQGRIEDMSKLDAFVLGTCRNMSWDMRRSAQRRERVARESTALSPDTFEPQLLSVDRLKLEGCLRALDGRELSVIRMTFVEDCSAEEIGRELHVSPGNVRVIRHRALARLHACMEGAA